MALALRMIPAEIPSFEELGLPPVAEWLARLPRGSRPGDRTDRLGQVDHPRFHHRPHQRDPGAAHPDHRGPDRVRTRAQSVRGQPARDRRRQPLASNGRCARLCARTPTSCSSARCATSSPSSSRSRMAETGHLVFSTLHTNDAAQAIDRIIDVFPAFRQEQIRVQLSASLGAVSRSGWCRGSAAAWSPPSRS